MNNRVALLLAIVVAVGLIVAAYFVGRAAGRQQFVDQCVTPAVTNVADCPELAR